MVSFGYDKTKKNTTTRKIEGKKDSFTEEYAIRLQNVQLECTDAIYIIQSRDSREAFFYCDPPYFNSDCGHYDGYTLEDFEALLKKLSGIQGKFLLSSYPSDLLVSYTDRCGWHTRRIEQKVSINSKAGAGKMKTKIEVLTANYPI